MFMTKLFFNIIFFVLIFLSCNKRYDDRKCFKSNGKEVSKEINLQDFNSIELDGNFKVFLKSDTLNRIEIVSGKNLINNIKADISDSILILKDNNKCRWLRSYNVKKEIYVYYKNINYLLINKQCDIISKDTVFVDDFEIIDWGDIGTINLKLHCINFRFTVHSGTGDFYFSGITQNQFLYFHGNGYVHAKDLQSSYCDVTSKTTGDIEVFSDNNLFVKLYESGNIYYYGAPLNITKSVKYSSGDLIKGK